MSVTFTLEEYFRNGLETLTWRSYSGLMVYRIILARVEANWIVLADNFLIILISVIFFLSLTRTYDV